jgi:hypothetical protein
MRSIHSLLDRRARSSNTRVSRGVFLFAATALASISVLNGPAARANTPDGSAYQTDSGVANGTSVDVAAGNPNPARITDESWWLMEQLLSLQTGSQNGGIYANKPGYHNTRGANPAGNYSIRAPEDLGGPSDKAAAYDWTFPDAQNGNYATISTYSKRLLASGQDPNDPRMDGWKEFFGQADNDGDVEGWDFRRDQSSSSDDSHLWHIHLSEDRDKVTSLDNKRAVLSVLKGETVAQWRVGTNRHAVGVDTADRLQVFTTGADGAPYLRSQTTSGGAWGGWTAMTGKVTGITAISNADGRLEVFGTGTDGAPWHNWQLTPGGAWNGWTSMTGKISGIAAINNADGRLEVFGTGTDGAPWHNYQTSAGGWSGWISMTGKISGIAALRRTDGALEIFGTGTDGAPWHNWQSTPGGSWYGWVSMTGKVSGIAAINDADGRMEIFGTGTDGAPWHNWQLTPGGAWNGWVSMTGKVSGIAAVRNADGRLEIFGLGTDGATWHNWEQSPGSWSGWYSLGRPI